MDAGEVFFPAIMFLPVDATFNPAVDAADNAGVAMITPFPVAVRITRVVTDIAAGIVMAVALSGVMMAIVAMMAAMTIVDVATVVVMAAAIVGPPIIDVLFAIDLLVAVPLIIVVVVNDGNENATKKRAENRADGEVRVVGLGALGRSDGDKRQGGHSGQKLSEHGLAPLVWA